MPGFIFERHECDSLGRAGTLTEQDQSGDLVATVGRNGLERGGGNHSLLLQKRTQRTQRMTPQRQALRIVVMNDFLGR